ncbi:hypothetical protein BTVI_26624 [Pitangus sulphuratus]|nr:hypothetical protein BTVI_26624 [Pitangus sulphuratus]
MISHATIYSKSEGCGEKAVAGTIRNRQIFKTSPDVGDQESASVLFEMVLGTAKNQYVRAFTTEDTAVTVERDPHTEEKARVRKEVKEHVTKIAYVGGWMNSKIQFPLLLGIFKQQEDDSVKKEAYRAPRRRVDGARMARRATQFFEEWKGRECPEPQTISVLLRGVNTFRNQRIRNSGVKNNWQHLQVPPVPGEWGGKIFEVGGKENSEKLRSILQMLNYEFTVFCKG